MKKIVMPCGVPGYKRFGKPVLTKAFVSIEWTDGKLSICGVVGPEPHGGCVGSAGQCVDEIRDGVPAQGWTQGMLDKLCYIWDAWHLNDMRPYCPHQKELGWDKLAGKKVPLYHYSLNTEVYEKKREIEKLALAALSVGKTFTPTKEMAIIASMPLSITVHEELPGEKAEFYHPHKPLFPSDHGPVEIKMLGWLTPDEHPEGILTKECPVCGYKYGTKWLKEEVPQEVVDWLFALPDTPIQPTWC